MLLKIIGNYGRKSYNILSVFVEVTKRCFSHGNREIRIFVGVGGRVEGPTIINKYAGCTRDDHFGVDSDAGRHYLYCKKGCKADFKVTILGKSFYLSEISLK